MGDAEAAEAVEALFLDTKFFQNRVQGATKEIRLEKWCPRVGLEDEALLSIADEITEHNRNSGMQVHLTESVHRFGSLDS